MMDKIAEQYKELERKIAARSKIRSKNKRMRSKKQLSKDLDRATDNFKSLRKRLLKIRSDKSKLELTLEDIEKKFEDARSEMLNLNKILRNLALVDSNKVIFYPNDCEDVGYVIDGEEYCLDVGSDGETNTQLMSERRKQQRAEERARKQQECADNLLAEDEEPELPDVTNEEFPSIRFLEE